MDNIRGPPLKILLLPNFKSYAPIYLASHIQTQFNSAVALSHMCDCIIQFDQSPQRPVLSVCSVLRYSNMVKQSKSWLEAVFWGEI